MSEHTDTNLDRIVEGIKAEYTKIARIPPQATEVIFQQRLEDSLSRHTAPDQAIAHAAGNLKGYVEAVKITRRAAHSFRNRFPYNRWFNKGDDTENSYKNLLIQDGGFPETLAASFAAGYAQAMKEHEENLVSHLPQHS
jgi:hypothetical protein